MLFKWINVLITFQIFYLLASEHLNWSTMSQPTRKVVVVQEPYKYNDQNEGYQDARSVAVETVPSDVSN